MRVLNIVVGAAFCYVFYLQFLFQRGTYRIFIYAFIGSARPIARTVQARTANRRAVATAAAERVRADQEIAARQGYPGTESSSRAPSQGRYGVGPAQHC